MRNFRHDRENRLNDEEDDHEFFLFPRNNYAINSRNNMYASLMTQFRSILTKLHLCYTPNLGPADAILVRKIAEKPRTCNKF